MSQGSKRLNRGLITARMADLGLTQAQLLRRMLKIGDTDLRPNRQWLTQVLNGQTKSPGIDHVYLIAAALDCTVDDLGQVRK